MVKTSTVRIHDGKEDPTKTRLESLGFTNESINDIVKLLLWAWQNPNRRMHDPRVNRRMFYPRMSEEEAEELLNKLARESGEPQKSIREIRAQMEEE